MWTAGGRLQGLGMAYGAWDVVEVGCTAWCRCKDYGMEGLHASCMPRHVMAGRASVASVRSCELLGASFGAGMDAVVQETGLTVRWLLGCG